MTESGIKRHSLKKPLRVPKDLGEADNILKAIDREIGFYRRRAGQVFFFGLLVEGIIIAGREKVFAETAISWVQPLIYSILLAAVAAVGIALGSEYRRRIHFMKDSRVELLEKLHYNFIYPTEADQKLSEIQVLYVVLTFLSSAGITLVWLKPLCSEIPLDFFYYIPFSIFLLIGVSGLLYSMWKLGGWLRPFKASNENK